MNREEAKKILDTCVRHELTDHAFGDKEVTWTKDGEHIATGYFGGSMDSVHMESEGPSFNDAETQELKNAGTLGEVGRNDETGPDEFVEGKVMPALTLEGVRQELEGG